MRNVSTVAVALAAALLVVACGDDAPPRATGSQTPSSQPASALPTFQASQVREIHDDIQSRTAELRAAGADVASLRVDEGARVVVVLLRGDVAKGTAVLHARYPREALRIEGGDAGH